MPASYRIDLRAGVVFTVFEGHVTNEATGPPAAIVGGPEFRPTMNHVIDASAVTATAVTAFGVRLVATPSIFAAGSRRAVIAGAANHSSGYLNMFKSLRSQSGEGIKLFSTIEDAHRWLGLE